MPNDWLRHNLRLIDRQYGRNESDSFLRHNDLVNRRKGDEAKCGYDNDVNCAAGNIALP